MSGYGQFCPVAKAMEVLDERWTLLVIRELLMGSRHFNELRRGVPRMSPALLSKRLKSLERAGLVTRHPNGRGTAYELTECGAELFDVVNGLGLWGLKWLPDLGDQDLDPHLLMWDIRRTLPPDQWPPGRTTVAVVFPDVDRRAARWWVVVADGDVDICDADPGYPVAVTLTVPLRTLTLVWRGELSWARAIKSGAVQLEGPVRERRRLPAWFGTSLLAQAAARSRSAVSATPA